MENPLVSPLNESLDGCEHQQNICITQAYGNTISNSQAIYVVVGCHLNI